MTLVFEQELELFLTQHPTMSLVPSRYNSIIIEGDFAFSASDPLYNFVEDSFRIRIEIPRAFPSEVPKVTEIGDKIPHNIDFHVFPNGTLCLGSPIRLRKCLNENPTLQGFIEKSLIPFLYAMSKHLRTGERFVFGELTHGVEGLLDDYRDVFHVETNKQVIQILELLSVKKRESNKKKCPCGCGKRVAKCSFKEKLNLLRNITSRSVFKKELDRIVDYLNRPSASQ